MSYDSRLPFNLELRVALVFWHWADECRMGHNPTAVGT